MPQGVPNIKQLDALVSAALSHALSGSGPAVPTNKYSFLTDPTFLSALGAPSGIGLPAGISSGGGRASTTALPASTIKLQGSVNRIGHQQNHQSIFHRVLDVMSRPMYAVAEAARQGLEGDVGHKSVGNTLENIASGAWHGLEGKKKTDWSQILTEAGQLHNLGRQGESIQQALKDVNSGKPVKSDINPWVAGIGGFAGDVAFDPTTYLGLGLATKVKEGAQLPEDINRAKNIQKTLEEAGHVEDSKGVPKVLLGGDIKVGKFYRKGALRNSAQRANLMQNADRIANKFGDASWQNFLKSAGVQATKAVAEQGYKKYDTVKDLRKALAGSDTLKATKGIVSNENLASYNHFVQKLIDSHAQELVGTATKAEHLKSAAAEVMELASRNNFAGKEASKLLEKHLAVRVAGKDVAHFKVPNAIADASKVIGASKAVKPVKDFTTAVHNHVDEIFRTGSHIDPVVNAMRMAAHSSVIEKVNRHVENLKSIWGRVSKADRARVADAVTKGLKNVTIAGGHDLSHGVDVHNLVNHTDQELQHLQSLVGKHDGALVTEQEMNAKLPKVLQIKSQYHGNPNWLRDAWRGQFLDKNATYGVKRIGSDPAVFLHTMQKAILSARAEKDMTGTIIDRFGHQLRGTQGYGMKNAMNPAARALRDSHGYRVPVFKDATGKTKIIPGYGNHIFHPDVARGIEAMHNMTHMNAKLAESMATHKYHVLFNDATQMFKSVVTKFNPGFHERNLIGEMANSIADGVVTSKPYRQALQVLRLHGRMALDTGEKISHKAGRIHNGILPDAYAKARIAAIDGKDAIVKKSFTVEGGKSVQPTADMIWHAYVANGLKTGWISTEFGKVVQGGMGRRALRGINSGAQHVTENIEDYSRLAHFISRIERSHSRDFETAAEEAAGYVRKYHFDYNDFTHFEKSIASKAIPFYKWTRKNIPLQMALMFQKPGYMLAQMKALSGISHGMGYTNNGDTIPNASEVMPIWLKDALAVPVGQGSSGTRYLDAPLPTKDAFKFFGEGPKDTLDNLAYMVNPMFKIPAELATRHQIGGAPVQTDRYVAGLTPYTNFLHNLINKQNTGKGTNLLQFLTGLGFVENTPARIKSELKRQQSEGSAARKKYRTSHGMLPVGGRPN